MAQVADLPDRARQSSVPLGAMVAVRCPSELAPLMQGRPIASIPPVGRLNLQAFGHRFILRR